MHADDSRRVVVVGSGPAGAAAATSLLQQGVPVTMLESGDATPGGFLVQVAGTLIWRKRVPLHHSNLHIASGDPETLWYQALEPGGLSNYWAGAVPRFAPEDFFEGARLDERYRWPLTYDALAPYYEWIERRLCVSAAPYAVAQLPASQVARTVRLPGEWQVVARSAKQIGRGLTPMPQASGPPWLVARRSTPFSSLAWIAALQRRYADFKLVLGAHVLRLDWDGSTRRVRRVIYADRASGAQHALSCNAVFLAAGALASTRLLMLSSSTDFPEGLGNTHGVLGAYLHDHATNWAQVQLAVPVARLGQTAYLTREPYDIAPPLMAAGCTFVPPTFKERVLAMTPLKTRTVGVVVFGTMVPSEKYRMSLSDKRTEAFGQAAIDVDIRFDDDVARNVSAARETAYSVLQSAGHRPVASSPAGPLIPGASNHYGGTIRMHESPRYGMADGWGRLHAVPNVVIGDASSFTTGPEKNPTLTVMALAARAAHRLSDDLKRGC